MALCLVKKENTDFTFTKGLLWQVMQKNYAFTRVYPKVSGLNRYAYNNKLSLGSNTKGYGGKTH
jgi:hypothetical protein